MGLVYEFVEGANSAPPGIIYDQSIPADTQVMEGTSITLYVSTGPLYDPEGVGPSDEAPLPDAESGEETPSEGHP